MHNICGINELDDFIIDNIQQDKIVMLYFGAEWCGPCSQLKKKLADQESKKIMPRLVVAHMDIDEPDNDSLVKRYKIQSLPTQILINVVNNKVVEVARIEGFDFIKLTMEYEKIAN
jgi:thioredoxin 1